MMYNANIYVNGTSTSTASRDIKILIQSLFLYMAKNFKYEYFAWACFIASVNSCLKTINHGKDK